MAGFFSFPNPVNEKAARTVAAGVVALTVITLITSHPIPLVLLTLGFWGRVLAGPRLSPLGWLAQRVIAPRFGLPNFVPGPPKRFAQGIGTVFTTTATIWWPRALRHSWVSASAAISLDTFKTGVSSLQACARRATTSRSARSLLDLPLLLFESALLVTLNRNGTLRVRWDVMIGDEQASTAPLS
jgi:hypothetical protein